MLEMFLLLYVLFFLTKDIIINFADRIRIIHPNIPRTIS